MVWGNVTTRLWQEDTVHSIEIYTLRRDGSASACIGFMGDGRSGDLGVRVGNIGALKHVEITTARARLATYRSTHTHFVLTLP